MRQILHFILAILAVPIALLVGFQVYWVVQMARLGDWIWPDADRGDCWTFALPRWAAHGGYLQVSLIPLGWMRIPRAAWQRPDGVVERAEPLERAETPREAWYGLKVLYFRFRILRRDPRE